MSEEILAAERRVVAESHDVLREVFEVSYRRLVVQLYGLTGDLAEAEDLVQEAFVKAAAARRRFAKVDNHEAWLRTTAIHLHRNRFRKMRNFSRIRHRLEHPTDPAGLEEHVWVINALRTLPEHQRQVVALHYLADLPLAEIAATLGCPTGTVKSRLKRGREALAATLGPWEGSSHD